MITALAAIQLEIGGDVLASADAYRNHLEAVAASAADRGGAADARLIVFPEVAGHLALYALAPPAARRAKTLASALAAAAVRRPLEVLRGVASTRLLDARHAVLAALAPDAERFWKAVFGPLARRHASYIVAGSHLRLGANGELKNSSLLFGPDGRHLATTDKVNLVPGLEDGVKGGLALARGDAAAIPITETTFGRVATLIGYDAFPRPRTALERFVPLGPSLTARGGVTVLANPTAAPDAATAGVSALLAETPCARYAVSAHLTGAVLDLEFSGAAQVLERTEGGTRALGDHVVLVDHG